MMLHSSHTLQVQGLAEVGRVRKPSGLCTWSSPRLIGS